jgi:transposase InsO family protein
MASSGDLVRLATATPHRSRSLQGTSRGEVMATIAMDRLQAAFDMTSELVDGLDETDIGRTLPQPSNTIWDQIWCVVGARESYAKAIAAGDWVGFTCSLTRTDRGSKKRLRAALETSRRAVVDAVTVAGNGSEERVLDLLLHETQHHGQLIRFVYGLGLEFPRGWRRRWNL